MCLQLWVGDFNALTREDYTQKQWDAIASKRFKKLLGGAQNRGQPPKAKELVNFLSVQADGAAEVKRAYL